MRTDKDILFALLRNGDEISRRQQLSLTAKLSVPAIMTQISFILVQYIDASMVGHLGAECSAAVGLMSTSTWLLGGLSECMVAGFSVMVAHKIGASRNLEARDILRQAFSVCIVWGLLLSGLGMTISDKLPHWLNGGDDICPLSSDYFFVFSAGIPFFQLNYLSASMLRSAGNIKIPTILNVLMCLLDVVFNFFLIYPSHELQLFGSQIVLPGANLGVKGAAMGSAMAFAVVSVLMTSYLVLRSKELKIYGEQGSFRPQKECISKALKISVPVGCERAIMCIAGIIVTAIVAPLGNVSISADTLAITIEGICYMPGFGIGDAATTLVGQSIGAGRKALARSFGYITVTTSMVVLTIMSTFMFIFSRELMSAMTPNEEIIELGSQILRIEAIAEPFFGAAIVSYSIFVGAGNSLLPNIINMTSMWIVRIPLAMYMAANHGLTGVWVAMCIELIVRGIIFLCFLKSPKWLDTQAVRDFEKKEKTL